MFDRLQVFADVGKESFFFWGARQTGKSTLLKAHFPDALWVDLLMSEWYLRLTRRPETLRELVLAKPEKSTIVIDEIQRVPILLNEIHWLMVNAPRQFIMSASSPRKILRSGENLLGGRALRYELYPLISREIPDFDLLRGINHGMLPRHYIADQPRKLLGAYIGNYLRDEIVAEAKLRDATVFSRFLEAAAFSNGELVNYTNIAAECGVSAPTIREYFQILEDTMIGRWVPVFQKKPKRRVIQAPKFYYFDVGIANHLLKRNQILPGSEAFGTAFEHFIFQEIYAHSHYSGLDYPISYWRTASQIEVDFILGNHELAIEVKGSDNITTRHLKGLKAFCEEYTVKQAIVVCTEPEPRLLGDILILPWKMFLERLWAGEWLR
jgi:predicted AAA+ superfamily ATPase